MSEIKYLDKIGLQHLVEEIDKKHFARIVTYKPGFGTIITPNNNIVAEVKYEQRDTEWKSFSWTNAGWLSGSHIWVDYNGVIHYDWDFQSDHKYLAEDGVTWVTKTWKGFSGINGSRVWMDYNNNIHYDYSNVHYILGSDNETWEAYTYTGLTVIDRGLWTDYDGIVHYDKGTSHYKLLSDCRTWEEVKWPDVVITAGEKVWKDASGVLHYDDTNTHAVLSDTGVWRKYTWIGDISIPNGDHVWKSTNGIYHYDDGSTHYVLDENMTWSTFSWPGNVDITANYIWNDPNGITHYDYKDNSNNYHFYLEKEEHKYITNHGDELQTKLTAGSNITIENGVISSTGGGSTDNFYTKAEVDEKLSTIPKFSTKVVSALPTSDISTTTIYLLVSTSSKTGNLYTEYIYVDSKWEKLGEQGSDFQIDTSIPATPSDTHALSTKAIDDIRKYGTYAHQFWGTNGAATYIHFCRLKTKTQWNDEFCKFEISGRYTHGNIYFKLTGSSGAADAGGYRPIIGPTITYQSDINTESYLYWNQPDQYTLDLYWKKLQANEQYSITSIDIGAYARAGLEITWLDSQVATLPTGNTQASFKSVNDCLPLSGGTMTGTISKFGSGTILEVHEHPQSANAWYCDGYKIETAFSGSGDENKLSIYSSVGSKTGDPVNWVERITITGANDIILKNRLTVNETRTGAASLIDYQQNGTRWGYMGFSAANTPSVYLTDGIKKNISLEGHTHSEYAPKTLRWGGINGASGTGNKYIIIGEYTHTPALYKEWAITLRIRGGHSTLHSDTTIRIWATDLDTTIISQNPGIRHLSLPHGNMPHIRLYKVSNTKTQIGLYKGNDWTNCICELLDVTGTTFTALDTQVSKTVQDAYALDYDCADQTIINNRITINELRSGYASVLHYQYQGSPLGYIGFSEASIPIIYTADGISKKNISTYPTTVTPVNGIQPLDLLSLTNAGKRLGGDPTFIDGHNGIVVYNNKNNGMVSITRGVYSTFAQPSPNNGSNQILCIKTVGEANPGYGGFLQSVVSRPNQVCVQILKAKVPAGYELKLAANPLGTGSTLEFITPNKGTGKWEWYGALIKCGNDAAGNTFGFFYIDNTGKPAASSSAPMTWYVAYSEVIDLGEAPSRVLNSLTSTSTTDSLSAAQGKALNDKFASYLPLTGGTLTGDLTLNSSGTIASGNTKAVTGGTVYNYCKDAVKYINVNGESVVTGQPGDKRVDLNIVPYTVYSCSRTGSVGELECIASTQADKLTSTTPEVQTFYVKNNKSASLCGTLTVMWNGSQLSMSSDNPALALYIVAENYDSTGYLYGLVYESGVKWEIQTLDKNALFIYSGNFTESVDDIIPVYLTSKGELYSRVRITYTPGAYPIASVIENNGIQGTAYNARRPYFSLPTGLNEAWAKNFFLAHTYQVVFTYNNLKKRIPIEITGIELTQASSVWQISISIDWQSNEARITDINDTITEYLIKAI